MAKLGTRMDEKQVRAIAAPAWTDTWHPTSHGAVIDAVGLAVEKVGMGIVNRQYTVACKGTRMFGSWSLDDIKSGVGYAIGFRNSTDKRFAVGMCSGTHVVVCSNMMFSGRYTEFRMHTSGLDAGSLADMAQRALKGLLEKLEQGRKWLLGLKKVELSAEDFKVLTFNAMERGFIPPSSFRTFLDACQTERGSYGGTLWQFYNAYTRLVREDSLFGVAYRTGGLMRMIENKA